MFIDGHCVPGTILDSHISRCRAAPLESIRQMCRQISRGSAGDYAVDEQAGVSRLNWRLSMFFFFNAVRLRVGCYTVKDDGKSTEDKRCHLLVSLMTLHCLLRSI